VLARFQLTATASLDDHRQRSAYGGMLLLGQQKQAPSPGRRRPVPPEAGRPRSRYRTIAFVSVAPLSR
jgi:hypothetical protein